MRSSIFLKLFLAILITCMVVAMAMGIAVRFSFERGFTDYIKEREAQRLETLASILEGDYEQHGSWDFLRDDNSRWWRIARSAHAAGRGGPRTGPMPRTVLIDEQGMIVVGRPLQQGHDVQRYPLKADGKVIGWLATPKLRQMPIDDVADQRFQSQQLQATWSIVGLSVLLAALVSFLLARLLLSPVRRIAHATHRLAAGDYATRVSVKARDELGLLADDFNRLANVLEKNEALRRGLTADISHELRTPLAVLRGEIEALQDGLREPTPETLASLQHEILLLNKLIDDLYELSLADVGALSYRMSAVDISELAQRVLEGFSSRFQEAGIEVSVDAPEPVVIQGDAHRLTQLMNNLLQNSLNYTDGPGEVRLSVKAQRDTAVVILEDSAPGVPQAMHERLFERLFRVDGSRRRASGGAGLGLAICQRIVQAHGGRIQASSSHLGGLRMMVTFASHKASSSYE